MNEDDQRQIQDDKKMDLLEDLEQVTQQKDNEEEQKKVKILVTPVKRKASGSKMGIYLNDQPDTKKTLEFAASKFEQINGRAASEEDTKRLKDFLETGMLFESEVDPKEKEKEQEQDDDDEEDEDYDPTKDIEDERFLEEDDNENEENDDTSNMIDID